MPNVSTPGGAYVSPPPLVRIGAHPDAFPEQEYAVCEPTDILTEAELSFMIYNLHGNENSFTFALEGDGVFVWVCTDPLCIFDDDRLAVVGAVDKPDLCYACIAPARLVADGAATYRASGPPVLERGGSVRHGIVTISPETPDAGA